MPSSACDWSSDVCSSDRSEEHTSELQSRSDLVCRLLLEKKKQTSEVQSRSDLVYSLLLQKKNRSCARHARDALRGQHDLALRPAQACAIGQTDRRRALRF